MTGKRGRPAKNQQQVLQEEQNKVMRERPVHHQDERSRLMATLDEMEQLASKRVKGGERVPISAKLKLQWSDQEPGFHYQWASDSSSYPISLQQMCDAGYTFVRHKHGSQTGEMITKDSVGCTLYLMRQPVEFFEEDQREVHAKNNALMQDIKGVGAREYAGDSKELGKGKVAKLEYTESPDAVSILDGEA